MEVTKVVVGDSVDTANGVEESFTVLAPSRLGVGALSVVKFGNSDAFEFAFVFVGFSVHSANRFVQIGTSAVSDAASLVLEFGSSAVHHAERLVSDVIVTADRGEIERTSAVGEVRFEVGDTAGSEIGDVDSGTLSEFTEIGVGYSVGSADRVENVIAERAFLVGSFSVSVFGSFVGFGDSFSAYFLFAPSFRLEFLSQKHENALIGKGFIFGRTNGFVAENAVGKDWVGVAVEEVLSVVVLSQSLGVGK